MYQQLLRDVLASDKPLIGAQVSIDLREGLPILYDVGIVFDDLKEEAKSGGFDYLIDAIRQLSDGVTDYVVPDPYEDREAFPPFAESWQFHADGNGLSVVAHLRDGDARDDVPYAAVQFALVLTIVAARIGKPACWVKINYGSLGAANRVEAAQWAELSVPIGRLVVERQIVGRNLGSLRMAFEGTLEIVA